jgi:hypothetical protein
VSKLKVFTNDYDTVIATDATDARRVMAEHVGSYDDAGEDWRALPDDHVLRIEDIDNVLAKKHGLTPDWNNRIALTCSQWALLEGRGFLCTTEY